MSGSYPVLNLRSGLGQAQPAPLSSDQAAQWVTKINSALSAVATIQGWVAAHAPQAASVGLDKDAAALPPTGNLQDYPVLAGIVSDLQAGRPVDMTQLACIDQLTAATQAANTKIAAFPRSFSDFITSPVGIGVAAGVGAIGVGLSRLL